MATAVQSATVSWSQLAASHEWRALSLPRRVWVTAYLSNGGDIFAATRTAYPDATEKSSRCMAYELRKAPEIVAALEFYHGGVTREVLLAEVRAAIRKAKPGSVAHQKLLAQLERLVIGIKFGWQEVDDQDEPETDSIESAETTSPAQQVPEDALEVWSDPKTGALIGYRDRSGEAIKL